MFTSGDGSKFVTVDSNLTDDLREEGMVNDFLRRYRDLRKRKGLKIDDTVSLRLKIEDESLLNLLKKYTQENLEELHATEVLFNEDEKEYSDILKVLGNDVLVNMQEV